MVSDIIAGDGGTAVFRDTRRYFWAGPIIVAISPIIGIALAHVTGNELFTYVTAILWYVALPIIDALAGRAWRNLPEQAIPALEADNYYRYLVYASIPLLILTWIVGVWAVATQDYSWVGYVGVSVCVALTNGLALVAGHELCHKVDRRDNRIGQFAFAVAAYGHFPPEHNRGHHAIAATPADTATSRFGESFYSFIIREVTGNIVGGIVQEKMRLARKGKGFFSVENEILQTFSITLVLYGLALAYFGVVIIPFMVISTLGGWHFMSVFNYLSHYGLLREKMPSGRYEPMRRAHSWNARHVVSNCLLFNVQHHSAHHVSPPQRYQAMESGDAPELPGGFPLCFLLTYIPPLWRAAVDPRVLKIYGGDITKVHLDPGKKAKILARYGQPADLPS